MREHREGCRVVHDGYGTCHCKPMTTPLTREQVEKDAIKALQCLYIAVDEPIAKDVNEKVVSLIDSYRNDITQQAQEIEILQQAKQQWYRAAMAAEQEIERLKGLLQHYSESDTLP